jgi:uncharacterized protein YciI
MTELSMDQIQARMGRVNLFAIFMRPTDKYDVSTPEGQDLMGQHLQFQLDLEDRGILLAAGPLNLQTPAPIGRRPSAEPDPIVDASGMYFVAARTREDAESIAASEPFERAGWRTHTVCTWMLNEGARGAARAPPGRGHSGGLTTCVRGSLRGDRRRGYRWPLAGNWPGARRDRG